MLILVVLFVISFTGVENDESRCIVHNRVCVTHCPRDMHPYHTRCDMDAKSQRTCDEPIVYILGYTCGWSRCDCNGDLLLDEKTQTCVDYFTCTHISKRRSRGKRPRKMKVKIPEDDEMSKK